MTPYKVATRELIFQINWRKRAIAKAIAANEENRMFLELLDTEINVLIEVLKQICREVRYFRWTGRIWRDVT